MPVSIGGSGFITGLDQGIDGVGIITATSFSGPLTGNVTGDLTSSGVSTVGQLNVGTGGTIITTTAGGLVGINSTSPERRLDVVDSGASGSVIRSRVTTNNGGYLAYEALNSSGTSVFSVTHNGRINLSENIVFASGQGLDFSATSDATGMTSELLDDYEEGTWTPGIFDSATGTKTLIGSEGWYTKIGRMIYLGFALNSLNSSTSGDSAITGIPFTSASINQVGACFIADVSGVTYASGYGDIYGRINGTANEIQLLQKTTNGTTHTSMAGGSLGTGLVLRGMCMYIV